MKLIRSIGRFLRGWSPWHLRRDLRHEERQHMLCRSALRGACISIDKAQARNKASRKVAKAALAKRGVKPAWANPKKVKR